MIDQSFMKHLLCLFLVLSPFLSPGQNGTPCYKAVTGSGVQATPVQNGVLCVACNFISNPSNLSDASTTNYATVSSLVGVVANSGVSVKNTTPGFSYTGGWYAGFLAEMKPSMLTASVLNSLWVQTFLNGTLQETYNYSASLASVEVVGGGDGMLWIQFKTTAGKDFNEIRLVSSNVLDALDGARIYYAMAFDPNCGINENNGVCGDQIAGASTHVTMGGELLNALNALSNPQYIIDGDKNTYGIYNASLVSSGTLGNPYIAVKDVDNIYPAGNRTGFVIGSGGTVLDAALLNGLTIQTYLHGVLQDQQTYNSGSGLMNVSAVSYLNDRTKLSITTTKAFNEVRLAFDPVVTASLSNLKIYYGFEEPTTCADCTPGLYSDISTSSAYYSSIVGGETGTVGGLGACIGASVNNAGNVTTSSQTDFATITALIGLSCNGRITVQKNSGTFAAGTFAGFEIAKDNSGLLDVLSLSALDAISVEAYNGSTFVSSSSGAALLNGGIVAGTGSKTTVGFKPTAAFNKIRIIVNMGAVSVATNYRIYRSIVIEDADNDGTPDCQDICTGSDALDSDGDGIPDACDTQTILPLNLISFVGYLNNSTSELNWVTAQEVNTDHFVVQRSNDGGTWKAIATMPAKGNNSASAKYSTSDDVSALSGTVYYRLQMVDHDGSYSYSKTISLHLINPGTTTWPNPFTNEINVSIYLNDNTAVEARLYDLNGKMVFSKTQPATKGMNRIQLDGLSNLKSGMYMIELRNGSTVHFSRILTKQ
ncbi:T9SS type A sorting domain-containing protein [Chitinophagaceae bacterium 26-R-25]|nr:T9SS type A sorting domain-containing protein [Chitinophagaceae bacterium 26-R-25]